MLASLNPLIQSLVMVNVRCLSLIISPMGLETLAAASASLGSWSLHCTRVVQCTHDTKGEGEGSGDVGEP